MPIEFTPVRRVQKRKTQASMFAPAFAYAVDAPGQYIEIKGIKGKDIKEKRAKVQSAVRRAEWNGKITVEQINNRIYVVAL